MTADLLRVLGLWRSRAGWLLAGMAVATLATLAGVALLALAGRGVAEGVTTATVFAGGAAALFWLRPVAVLRPVARYLDRLVSHAAAFRALSDTRVWFFRRLADRLPAGVGFRRTGDLLGRLVSDIDALDRVYLGALVPAVSAAAVVVAIALVLGGISPLLALLVAAPLALALLLPPLLAPGAAEAGRRVAAAQGSLRAAVVDPLTGIEDTLSAGAEPVASRRVAEEGAALSAAQRLLARRGAWGGAAGSVLTQAAMLAAIAWGLASGEAGVAGAVLGLFLATAAAEALGLMPRAGAALAAAGASARRLFEAADTPAPVAEPAAPAAPPSGHAIRMEGVRFTWAPDREAVFDGLDLDVPEGARIALLGPSGAGKSTLAALLLKLAAPQAGRITLGGVEIAALAADDLRARIACLTQDARLFDDTSRPICASPGRRPTPPRCGARWTRRASAIWCAACRTGSTRAAGRRGRGSPAASAAARAGPRAAVGRPGADSGRARGRPRPRHRARLPGNARRGDGGAECDPDRPPPDRRGAPDAHPAPGRRPRPAGDAVEHFQVRRTRRTTRNMRQDNSWSGFGEHRRAETAPAPQRPSPEPGKGKPRVSAGRCCPAGTSPASPRRPRPTSRSRDWPGSACRDGLLDGDLDPPDLAAVAVGDGGLDRGDQQLRLLRRQRVHAAEDAREHAELHPAGTVAIGHLDDDAEPAVAHARHQVALRADLQQHVAVGVADHPRGRRVLDARWSGWLAIAFSTRFTAARRSGETAWPTPNRAAALAIRPIGSATAGRPQPSMPCGRRLASTPVNSDRMSR
jgi:ATP-binding cassette subfamily C protein CydC